MDEHPRGRPPNRPQQHIQPQPQPQPQHEPSEASVRHNRNRNNDEEKFGKLKFKGEEDADTYIDWEFKEETIFRIHNYSEEKKVAMASLEFQDYANIRWEDLQVNRGKRDEPLIDTWHDMKVAMYQRFVPDHYHQDLFNKLQNLKQGFKSVEEYYKEMEITMMRGVVQELE
jgi:hypothetical protein